MSNCEAEPLTEEEIRGHNLLSEQLIENTENVENDSYEGGNDVEIK